MDVRAHNQLFLLGLASLGMGCAVGSDNNMTYGPMPTPAGTSAGSNTGDGTGPSATDDGSAATDATGPATAPPTTSEGPGDGSTSDEPPPGTTTYGDVDPYQACVAYGENYGYCFNEPRYIEYYIDDCLSYYYFFESQGAYACAAAFADYTACLGALTCDELMAPSPCAAEAAVFSALNCPKMP